MPFRLLLILGLFTSTAVASCQLEFSAYLRVGGQDLFVFGNPVTGKSSDWLRVGASFSGYSIGTFDAKSESVTVTKEGQTFTLLLRSSKLQAAAAEAEQAVTLTTRLEMARGVLKTMRMRLRNAHPAIQARLREITELERHLSEQAAKP